MSYLTYMAIDWAVEIVDEFEPEFAALAPQVQEEIAALVRLLRHFGPSLRRPHCDTLKGARHPNMKELRFTAAGGVWRLAFAFDPKRRAVLQVAGDKRGTSDVLLQDAHPHCGTSGLRAISRR